MGALGINGSWLVAYAINFAIVYFVIAKWVWPPISKTLDERRLRIQSSMEQAEEITRKLSEAEREARAELDKARHEGHAIITEAAKAGERLQAELAEDARKSADQMVNRARLQIQMETQVAIADLRSSVADLAIEAASKVVGQSLDSAAHRRIVEAVVAQSRDLQ